jgi:hypothetical protein
MDIPPSEKATSGLQNLGMQSGYNATPWTLRSKEKNAGEKVRL